MYLVDVYIEDVFMDVSTAFMYCTGFYQRLCLPSRGTKSSIIEANSYSVCIPTEFRQNSFNSYSAIRIYNILSSKITLIIK